MTTSHGVRALARSCQRSESRLTAESTAGPLSGVPETRTTSEIPCRQGARSGSAGRGSQKRAARHRLQLRSTWQQVNRSGRGDGKAKQRGTRNCAGRIEKPHQELEKRAVGLRGVYALTHAQFLGLFIRFRKEEGSVCQKDHRCWGCHMMLPVRNKTHRAYTHR